MIDSVERGFAYYKREYLRRGRLWDAYAVAAASHDRRAGDYRRCMLVALGFLLLAQRTTGCTDRERGGFGGSLANREQRVDVTGHVASGFIKSLENGVDVPGQRDSDRAY